MRAVEYLGAGGPEVVRLTERPDPEPGVGEVLIRVEAAGVNRPDIIQRTGHYPPPSGASDIPGLEVSGLVEAVGPAVHQWRIGDRVAALVSGGGYAELCVAPAVQCLPVPDVLPLAHGAALVETTLTVWTNLFERGALVAGERALVHGGASGIGTTAIQLAVARGAEVFVTAGTDERCLRCQDLGATGAVNYRSGDFAETLRARLGDRPFDVVLDMIGGDALPKNLELLRDEGRHVSIAFLRGRSAQLDIRAVMARRLHLTGSTLRARPLEEKARLVKEVATHAWPMLEDGRLSAVISHELPLEAAARAQQLLEQSLHFGKVLLRPVTGPSDQAIPKL